MGARVESDAASIVNFPACDSYGAKAFAGGDTADGVVHPAYAANDSIGSLRRRNFRLQIIWPRKSSIMLLTRLQDGSAAEGEDLK